MSFSLSVPRQDTVGDFDSAVFDTVESPKADGRTKVGKLQKVLVDVAKESLVSAAYDLSGQAAAYAGSISGHAAADGTGFVSTTLNLLGPAPE